MNAGTERHAAKVVVPVDQMGAFEKRLKALNVKAERFGLEAISVGEPLLTNYEIYREPNRSGSGEHVTLLPQGSAPPPEATRDGLVRMAQIPIEYPVIKLGDWRVVAKIEPAGADDNLVFVVSEDAADVAAAEGHRHQAIQCEHCGTERRRKASFLLAGEGGYKEVGQQCLEDFTGIDPAAALFLGKLHTFLSWDYLELGSGGPNAIATRQFLIDVLFLTEQCGFVSSSRAKCNPGTRATYQIAMDLAGELHDDAALREAYPDALDRLGTQADALREWYALNASATGFDANVRALLAQDTLLLDPKHLAFAAGAVPGYLRQQQRQRALALDTSAERRHVGVAGERSTMVLRVERMVIFDTRFGRQWLAIMRDREGNKLAWKTSSLPPDRFREAKPEQWFECQFKVKEHGDYQGVPQTQVTHLQLMGPTVEEGMEAGLSQDALDSTDTQEAPTP
ncbi:MAG: hypothetical protein ACREPQ_00610 [Rhodanobacter sp.]